MTNKIYYRESRLTYIAALIAIIGFWFFPKYLNFINLLFFVILGIIYNERLEERK
jgi:hypothetical protein